MDWFEEFKYPTSTYPSGELMEMNWVAKPVWHDLDTPWCPYVPRGILSEVDHPIAFVFEPHTVPCEEHVEEGDNGSASRSTYTLESAFRVSCARMALILRRTPTDYEGGPLPEWIHPGVVNSVFDDEVDAQRAAASFRCNLLDMLAFLAWFQAMRNDWARGLTNADRAFVQVLALPAHPKIGVLISPSRDWKSMNFPFLMKHGIPTHVLWSGAERSSERFQRFDPKFLKEYSHALSKAAPNTFVLAEDLPSYFLWQEACERYDLFLIDKRMGLNGDEFYPLAWYCIIDWPYWVRRWLTDREEIRAYSELYYGACAKHDSGVFITFFRQEPIGSDGGFRLSRPPQEREDIDRFGSESSHNTYLDRTLPYDESAISVREWYRTCCAPFKSKRYNTFNGRPVGANAAWAEEPYERDWNRLSPLPDNYSGSHSIDWRHSCTLAERLGRNYASGGDGPRPLSFAERLSSPPPHPFSRGVGEGYRARRRASRSLSPPRRLSYISRSPSPEVQPIPDADPPIFYDLEYHSNRDLSDGPLSFMDEYNHARTDAEPGNNAGAGGDDPPGTRETITFPPEVGASPHESYVEPRWNEENFRLELKSLAKVIISSDPAVEMVKTVTWNPLWLQKAVFIFDTVPAQIRLRLIANIYHGVDNIEDVLNTAILYGLPLQKLFVKSGDIPLFKQPELSTLELNTIAEENVGVVLNRPHAGAFVAEGGMLSWITQMFDKDLVNRFARGPSTKVTEYQRGRVVTGRLSGAPGDVFTCDQPSNDECEVIYGQIEHPHDMDKTHYLWPPQWMCEDLSLHFHGIMTTTCNDIFENIRRDIKNKKYLWRTRNGWSTYFRNGNRKKFRPSAIPASSDFQQAGALLSKAYKVDWNRRALVDVN
ncbi:hypothetical protein C8J57DRAFT_1623610 [Mycena rebaudengoi]|nr:hypothetical protein C8J57DRAFT_1623610 [Mycena rebaudengoi]